MKIQDLKQNTIILCSTDSLRFKVLSILTGAGIELDKEVEAFAKYPNVGVRVEDNNNYCFTTFFHNFGNKVNAEDFIEANS